MTKRMLIDGTHAEETRVVVLDGNRLEDFDVETATKKQLKGNIYLAKIVRVEPSLQAAFVEYGGNRHGFLAFGEIHPDYYQIPVADRQRLIALQAQEAREADEAEDAAAQAEEAVAQAVQAGAMSAPADTGAPDEPASDDRAAMVPAGNFEPQTGSGLEVTDAPAEPALADWPVGSDPAEQPDPAPAAMATMMDQQAIVGPELDDDDVMEANFFEPASVASLAELGLAVGEDGQISGDPEAMQQIAEVMDAENDHPHAAGTDRDETSEVEIAAPAVAGEPLGGDADASAERERRAASRLLRNYKIQEVIRRRQIMLVQVVKEERGGKGAALTTYISLAGRFCVLMPNSPSGGGISRKITSTADRRRLKEVTAELQIPSGMGLIVRTAGAARPKPEIRRDCEYLLQLWDDIRDTTMKSAAPAAIYEEASLIKRAIRDVYSRDVDEVQVDGEVAWRAARDQMRLLMPSHAHKVQLWHDPSGQPLFAHHQVDAQLDAMLSPTVQLRSGGYLVINQTEALVAIDVNSGRSTRERGIEETALRTNLEASDEVARQLRLRDLAGLIVIDYIDMEIRRNNAAVERKLADALKQDRARIQLGTISQFGLMELSRQRLRPSLTETSFVQCAHCGGTGLVRSTDGAAIHVLRAIEEEGGKRRAAEIMVSVAGPIAMYILNHKRDRLREIETRYSMTVLFTPDPALLPPAVKIDRLRSHAPGEAPPILAQPAPALTDADDAVFAGGEDIPDEVDEKPESAAPEQSARGLVPEADAGGEATRRRRRRRRRGGRREDGAAGTEAASALSQPGAEQPELGDAGPEPEMQAGLAEAEMQAVTHDDTTTTDTPDADGASASHGGEIDAAEGVRRRGRRGGRRRRKDAPDTGVDTPPVAQDEPPAIQGYSGPTPADPFGGNGAFDIFDALEQAEVQAELAAAIAASPSRVSAPAPPSASHALIEVETQPAAPATVATPGPIPAENELAASPVQPVDVPAEPVQAVPRSAPRPRPSRARKPAAKLALEPAPVLAEGAAAAPPATTELKPADAPAPVATTQTAAEPDVPVAEPRRGWWKR